MAAVYVSNIVINQGADFSQVFNLADSSNDSVDLTNYALTAQMRKHAGSSVSHNLNPTVVQPPTSGGVRITLTDVQTAALKPGRYVYDILFTDPSDKRSIVIEGQILATQDVSTDCIKTFYPNKFGFVYNSTDNQTVGPASVVGESTTVNEITLNDINDYGVVILGYADKCGGIPGTVELIQNNIGILEQYLSNGGVIWFRGEHGPGCAPSEDQNTALAALGTNIRVRGVSLDENTTTNISNSTVLPASLNHSATNGLDGGTPLYETSANGVISIAYQKIGSGVVFVNTDVNGSFTSPSNELYEGIRDLVVSDYSSTVTTPNYNPNP